MRWVNVIRPCPAEKAAQFDYQARINDSAPANAGYSLSQRPLDSMSQGVFEVQLLAKESMVNIEAATIKKLILGLLPGTFRH